MEVDEVEEEKEEGEALMIFSRFGTECWFRACESKAEETFHVKRLIYFSLYRCSSRAKQCQKASEVRDMQFSMQFSCL